MSAESQILREPTMRQIRAYELAFEQMARPFFLQIAKVNLYCNTRHFPVLPDGSLGHEVVTLNEKEKAAVDHCKEMIEVCQGIALRQAMGDDLVPMPR